MNKICLADDLIKNKEYYFKLIHYWKLIIDQSSSIIMTLNNKRLSLQKRDELKVGAIYVDFFDDKITYRRYFGGKYNEAIAKAIIIKDKKFTDVVDATAGFGKDAFILACLGCRVKMLERNPIIAALLDDGLKRAYNDSKIGGWLQNHLILYPHMNLIEFTRYYPMVDVVYLDPMFPLYKKTALNKKDIRMLRTIVGLDHDADKLLIPAQRLAMHKVVVKRPKIAKPLANNKPQSFINTKKYRFDIYKLQHSINFDK